MKAFQRRFIRDLSLWVMLLAVSGLSGVTVARAQDATPASPLATPTMEITATPTAAGDPDSPSTLAWVKPSVLAPSTSEALVAATARRTQDEAERAEVAQERRRVPTSPSSPARL